MSFQNVQNEFMSHIRDPDNHPDVEGIEDRRLKIYRDLFFNNIKGFLSSGFPVLESIVSAGDWEQLARQFFIQHDCRSPYFVDISKEFVEYLANGVPENEYLYPFIAELAHYEWLELDVSVRKSEELAFWEPSLSVDCFQLSPLAELVSYQWPVHQISPDYLPGAPSEVANFYIVYRNASHEVTFSEINQVTAHLVNCVANLETANVTDLTELMVEALPQLPPANVEQATKDIVTQMLGSQIFILA